MDIERSIKNQFIKYSFKFIKYSFKFMRYKFKFKIQFKKCKQIKINNTI